MLILGIETSCDDTGVAIVRASDKKRPIFNILSNIVSSQIKVHAKYGGVVPNLASREHLKNIEPCLRQAFQETNLKLSNTMPAGRQVDLIAVTIGPGLIPSLLIGVNYAKALAYKWKKPIVGVNHLEGHIATSFGFRDSGFEFPAIALLVSGGHTQLVLVKKIGKYKIIGETRDDAAGECFDKIAKLLGLGYPGGPVIAAQAAKLKVKSQKSKVNLPRPMINHKNYDFSFSGLKTAVLYLLKDLMGDIRCPDIKKILGHRMSYICAETQQAIIDVLIEKTLRAVKEYKAKTIILAGGVAANEELRRQFKLKIKNLKLKIEFLTPVKNLCTDNGAMIAMAGYYNKNKATKNCNKIKAGASLRLS